MGHINPKTVSELMDVVNKNSQTEKTRITIKERNHLKMTGLTGTAIRGADLETMTTTALTTK
jgi:hypothetical protein